MAIELAATEGRAMKRLQLIAAALCLVMFTTVGTGVVTAQKSAATPPTKGAITIPYKADTTYTWTPTQYNVHYTTKIVYAAEKMPPPKVQVWSRWSTASDSIQVTKTSAAGSAQAGAYVGVVVTVTPKDGYRFTGNEPVTVTYTGKYTISASGPDTNTYASVLDETHWHIRHTVEADGTGDAVTQSGTFDTPDASEISEFGTVDQATGNYVLTLWMVVWSGASGVSQASATVDVSSIELQFN